MKEIYKSVFNNLQSIHSHSMILFLSLMSANLIAYGYHIIIARLMNPADYGIMVTLTSVSYLLDVIVRTVQTTLTKTVSSLSGDDVDHVRKVYFLSFRVLLPIATMLFAIILFYSRWIANYLNMELIIPVILLGVYASLHFLVPIPRGILLGLGKINEASSTIILEPIARLVFGFVLVMWGWKVNGAITGYTIGGILAFLLGIIWIKPLLKKRSDVATGTNKIVSWDRYAIIVFIINICLMIMASIDQIIIKHYFSSEEAGNYAVTFVLGRVILMTAISLGVVIFTRSAQRLIDDSQRAAILKKGMLVMGVIALATLIITMLAPEFIIRIIAGSQYKFAQSYIGLVGIEMALFGLVYIQVYFQISISKMKLLFPLVISSIVEIVLLSFFHSSISQVLIILIIIIGSLLLYTSLTTYRLLRNRVINESVILHELSLAKEKDV